MLSCFSSCIFYECSECVRVGRTKAISIVRTRNRMKTEDLLSDVAAFFPGKSETEMTFFINKLLRCPDLVWSPDAPEYCYCAIYYAFELLKTTDDLVELKSWLTANGIHASVETAVAERAKATRVLCLVRINQKWHVKRATVLNAYDKPTLVAAILRQKISGISLKEAASEYAEAYVDIFASEKLFVKNGHIWHRTYAPRPPPVLFGALTPTVQVHTA